MSEGWGKNLQEMHKDVEEEPHRAEEGHVMPFNEIDLRRIEKVVVVSARTAFPITTDVDYEPVLCKLSSLKSSAAACSDLPDQTPVLVYLKPQ